MYRHKSILFLILTVFLAAVLRIYQLGLIPASLEWDEVAIGFDAYSVFKTGRDQFGEFLPLTFRSLDDWKPPVYEYLAVPPVAVFGLTPFATRLPSAIAGILTVLATYIFVKTVLKGVKISLLASFLLAVSPWHLQFSRAAFEVNVSVLITVLAVTAFIKGLKKPIFFIISAVLFGIDLFSYHSTRIVAPLLLISLFLIFNKMLPARKILTAFIIIFGLILLTFLPIAVSPNAQIRFKATNIFNPGARYLDERDLEKEFLDKRLEDIAIGFEQAGRIFHNQRFIYLDSATLKKALNHYLSNFSFDYLFIKGDAPLHHAPGFGLLHFWEFPFIVLGILYLLKFGLNRYTFILPLWLLFVPLPDAVTREAPHAVRTELFLPLWQLLGSLGIMAILKFLKRESYWVIIIFIILATTTFIVNHSYYLHQYYVHTDYELSKNWLYGREEAVKITENEKDKYDKVLVSMKVDMPYIFWLYYSKYDPQLYLSEGGTVSGGFADERNKFDKYEFRNFDYNDLPKDQKLLLVSTPDNFPPDAKIIKTVYYRNGTEALKIAVSR